MCFFVVIFGFFLSAKGVSAISVLDIVKAPADLVSWLVAQLALFLVEIVGKIVMLFIYILIVVANYNDFTNNPAVVNGWTVVRDVANMFFIMALLVIAFGTMLHRESYQWKKFLPNLLVMAVLINFSRLFCGLLIDLSQVVMMTFVNAFSSGGTGGFVAFLGIEKLTSPDGSLLNNVKLDYGVLAISMIMALVRLIIAGIVIIVMVLMLVIRIVMLWILIVLSPLAFLLSAMPMSQAQAKSKEWWAEFSKYLVVGPVLAFFLWLSLATISGPGKNIMSTDQAKNAVKGETAPTAGATTAGTWDDTLGFVIGIAMLAAGLMFAQKSGVAGAGLAGSALDGLKKQGMKPIKYAKDVGKSIGDFTYAKTGLALPMTAMRANAKKERDKNVSTMRIAEGQAKTATRMSGGRAYLASVLDPKASSKLTSLEMAKATLGYKDAQEKVKRAGESTLGGAVTSMRSVDAHRAFVLDNETRKNRGEKRKENLENKMEKTANEVPELADNFQETKQLKNNGVELNDKISKAEELEKKSKKSAEVNTRLAEVYSSGPGNFKKDEDERLQKESQSLETEKQNLETKAQSKEQEIKNKEEKKEKNQQQIENLSASKNPNDQKEVKRLKAENNLLGKEIGKGNKELAEDKGKITEVATKQRSADKQREELSKKSDKEAFDDAEKELNKENTTLNQEIKNIKAEIKVKIENENEGIRSKMVALQRENEKPGITPERKQANEKEIGRLNQEVRNNSIDLQLVDSGNFGDLAKDLNKQKIENDSKLEVVTNEKIQIEARIMSDNSKEGKAKQESLRNYQQYEAERDKAVNETREATINLQLSYVDQTAKAKKAAEAQSQEALTKKIMAAMNEGKISEKEGNDLFREWSEKGIKPGTKDIGDKLEEMLKASEKK